MSITVDNKSKFNQVNQWLWIFRHAKFEQFLGDKKEKLFIEISLEICKEWSANSKLSTQMNEAKPINSNKFIKFHSSKWFTKNSLSWINGK